MIIEHALPKAGEHCKALHAASQGNTRTLAKLVARSRRVAEINGAPLSPNLIKETARMLMV